MADAYLALERGDVLRARARAPGRARGELVFTTAYTGYEESLTDPSYEGQVLTFAYTLIGNYGVRPERFESDRVHPSAVVARNLTDDVADWLADEGVPAVEGVDTRDVVLDIRDGGAMQCGVAAGPDASPDDALAELDACDPLSDRTDIGSLVSVDEPTEYRSDGAGPHVALLDCGVKRSIVDSLHSRGADVTVLPHDATPAAVKSVDPDVLFVSNGPGDPATFAAAERVVDAVVGEIPVAGICLGQQVVARAMGGETAKMEFGHRGVNQPVRDRRTDRVVMTTQNHGYTVADPGALEVTQVNVNDDTPEGLASTDLDVLTRQYHPEASPGPRDTRSFFDDVLAMARPGAEQPVVADD